MTTLLAERSAIDKRVRNLRAERATIAAADRNDPRLLKLREELLDLEGQLDDLTAADQELERTAAARLSKADQDQRRTALKAIQNEIRLQQEAAQSIENAAEAFRVAVNAHRGSVQRTHSTLSRYCPTPRQRELLDTLLFEIPISDLASVLSRAGLAPLLIHQVVSSRSLSESVAARLDAARPTIYTLLNL